MEEPIRRSSRGAWTKEEVRGSLGNGDQGSVLWPFTWSVTPRRPGLRQVCTLYEQDAMLTEHVATNGPGSWGHIGEVQGGDPISSHLHCECQAGCAA